MKKTLIVITSYKRLGLLHNLLKSIKNNNISIYDDRSDFVIERENIDFIKLKKHYGKKYCWEKYRFIFSHIKKDYDYYIFLPDDVELCDYFVNKAIDLYESINDDDKICLSFSNPERIKKPCFTFLEPVDLGNVYKTGWNDLMFICDNRFFKEVEIEEIPLSRWEDGNELLGSGVGSQISWQLYKKGLNMYHAKEEMVKHLGNELSMMNPQEREKTPL